MKRNIKYIVIIIALIIVIGVLLLPKSKGDIKPVEITPLNPALNKDKPKEPLISHRILRDFDIKKLVDKDYVSFKKAQELDIDIYSEAYMLIDLDNRDVLFAKNYDDRRYPASLTKLLTLDTVLNLYDDLSKTSSITYLQQESLIKENASLAYIRVDYPYTIKDLLYALILPSGADAAIALENLLIEDGFDLIEEMNKQASKLKLDNTNIKNSTGLHDDEHYMSLNDLYKIVWDILKYEEGLKILSSFDYTFIDGSSTKSSLSYLKDIDVVDMRGGKTGFTGQAGENIVVYYQFNNCPYLLMLMNAKGNPYEGELYHFEDVINILTTLYN